MPANDKISRPKPRAHANGVPAAAARRGGRQGKRRYERTTPIGRARKNLVKAQRVLDIVKSRLVSWGAVPLAPAPADFKPNEDLLLGYQHVGKALEEISMCEGYLAALEESEFIPAKRSSIVVFKLDDEVRVGDKYREKYLEVYPSDVLDRLVVAKVLPSGEIAVKHGKVTFIAPKSHLGRREGRS